MAYVIKIKHADTLRRLTCEEQPGENGLSFAGLEEKIREMFQFPSSAKLNITYTDGDNDVVTMENDRDLKDACVYQALNPLRLNVNVVGSSPKFAPGLGTTVEGLDEQIKEFLQNLKPETFLSGWEDLLKDLKQHAPVPEIVDLLKNVASQFVPPTGRSGAGPSGTPASQKEPAPHHPVQGEPEAARNLNGSVHYHVSCDGCGMSPIVGVRYKSNAKKNYDLCGACYDKSGADPAMYQQIVEALPPRFFRGRPMCPAMGSFGYNPQFGMRGFHHGSHHGSYHGPHHGHGSRLDARFVRDVSIFDGTELAPGTRFTKIWRLRNSGSGPWPVNTKLVNVDGDNLGSAAVTPVEIPAAGLGPEEEVDVSVDCVAPEKPGRYQSTWRLASPWGPKFGHKIWVQIQVVPAETLNQPAHVDTEMEENQEGVHDASTVTPVEIMNVPIDTKGKSVMVGESSPDVFMSTQDEFIEADKSNENIQDTATVSAAEMKNMEDDFVKVDVSGGNVTETGHEVIELEKADEEVPAFKTAVVDNAAMVVERPTEEADDDGVMAKSLVKLENMGFTDRLLNEELLSLYNLDVRKTVDVLCEMEDWAPALGELEDMGFTDAVLNRQLMLKYRGHLKRVVRELVQMAKMASKKAD